MLLISCFVWSFVPSHDYSIYLFLSLRKENSHIAGQVKLGVHVMRLCQIMRRSDSNDVVNNDTLVALLLLLEGHMAFNNVHLRHYLFCILQVLAGRWVPFFLVILALNWVEMGVHNCYNLQFNACFAVLYLIIVFFCILLFLSPWPCLYDK